MVILYQQVDGLLLLLIFCVFFCLEEVFHDFLNSLAIFSSNVPNVFCNLAINLSQGRVEGVLMAEILHLFLRQPFIIIACRGCNKVFTICLVDTLGEQVGVKDNRNDDAQQLFLWQGQEGIIYLLYLFYKVVLREFWHKLLTSIVMIYAI